MHTWHTRALHRRGALWSRSAPQPGCLRQRHCPRQCVQLQAGGPAAPAASGPSWEQWLAQCSCFHASDMATQRVEQLQQQLQHELSRTYASEVERVKTRLDSLQLMQQMGPEDDAAAEAIAANKETLQQLQAAPDPTALIPDASARVLQLQLQLQQLASSDPMANARFALAAALEEEDYTTAAAAAAEGATWMEGWWVGSRQQPTTHQHPRQQQMEGQQQASKEIISSAASPGSRSGASDPQGHLLHVTAEHGRWVGRTHTADSVSKVAGFLDDNPLGISIQTVRFGSDPQVIISALGRRLGPPPWRLGVVAADPLQRTLSSEGCPTFEQYIPVAPQVVGTAQGAGNSSTAVSNTSSSSSSSQLDVGLQGVEGQSSPAAAGKGPEGSAGLAAVRLLGAAECITLASAPPESVLKEHLAANRAASTAATATGAASPTSTSASTAATTTSSSSGSSTNPDGVSTPRDSSSSSSSGSSELCAPPSKGVVTVYVEFGATAAADGREVARVGMLAQQLGLHRVWDLEVRPAAAPVAAGASSSSSSSSSPDTSSSASPSSSSSLSSSSAAAADFFSLEPPDKPLCRLAMWGDPSDVLLASTLTTSSITSSSSSSTSDGPISGTTTSSSSGESGAVPGLLRSQERPVEFSPCVVKNNQQRLPAAVCRTGQDSFALQDLWPPLQQLSPVAKHSSDTTSSSTTTTSSSSSSGRGAGVLDAAIEAANQACPFTWQQHLASATAHLPPVLTLHLPLREVDPDGQPPPRPAPWEPVHPSKEEVAAYKALKALKASTTKQQPQLLETGAVWQQLAQAAAALYSQVAGRPLPDEVVGEVAAQVCRYIADNLNPKGLAPELPINLLQEQQQQTGRQQVDAVQQPLPQQQQDQQQDQQQQAPLLSAWQVLPAAYTPPPAAVVYRRLQVPPAPGADEDPLTGIFIGAFGTQGRQLLQLTRATTTSPSGQPLVVATKLTGDSRLPAGSEVLRARVGAGQRLGLEGEGGEAEYPAELGVTARYPGEACMAAEGGGQQVWVPGELLLVSPSPDVPALQGASLGIRWGVAGGKQYMSLLNRLPLDQLA